MAEPEASTAVVVIAHGSRNDEANDAHRALCEALTERSGRPASPAFLELALPSLHDAIDALVTSGHERITVLPLFLYPGRHVREHIPALVEEARAAHPGVDIALGPLFGDDPGIVDLLLSQIGTSATKDR